MRRPYPAPIRGKEPFGNPGCLFREFSETCCVSGGAFEDAGYELIDMAMLMFFVTLIESEIVLVFFCRPAADNAQVRVEGPAKRLGPFVDTVVANKDFNRPSDAVGPSFVIFAQHAHHTGRVTPKSTGTIGRRTAKGKRPEDDEAQHEQ